jgi:hypothetical protein
MVVEMKSVTLTFNRLDGIGSTFGILTVLFAFQVNVKLVESRFRDAFSVKGPLSPLHFRSASFSVGGIFSPLRFRGCLFFSSEVLLALVF